MVNMVRLRRFILQEMRPLLNRDGETFHQSSTLALIGGEIACSRETIGPYDEAAVS